MLDLRVLAVGVMALMIAMAGSFNGPGATKPQSTVPQTAQSQPDPAIVHMLLTARCPPADPAAADCTSDVTGSITLKRN